MLWLSTGLDDPMCCGQLGGEQLGNCLGSNFRTNLFEFHNPPIGSSARSSYLHKQKCISVQMLNQKKNTIKQTKLRIHSPIHHVHVPFCVTNKRERMEKKGGEQTTRQKQRVPRNTMLLKNPLFRPLRNACLSNL